MIKPIAYYLPQFYPIPENDNWWGKGFTEWTNVTKAHPLFKGHNQPRFPADLGHYDLRVSEVRIAQAEMAESYGIHGFCYYSYWFGNGKIILDRVINEVLNSNSPDFPFCFCWANESWKGVWYGTGNQTALIEQRYLGRKDYEDYFNLLLKFFQDDRYIKVEGKPLFHIYKIADIPDLEVFVDTFNELAIRNGFPGIYIVAGLRNTSELHWNPFEHGCNAVTGPEFSSLRFLSSSVGSSDSFLGKLKRSIDYRFFRDKLNFEKRKSPVVIDYEKVIDRLVTDQSFDFPYFPIVIHDWDNSPRATSRSLIFHNSTPELFRIHLRKAIEKVANHKDQEQFIFLKSWNEWGESNALEPDSKWGHAYLKVILDEVSKTQRVL